MHISKAISFLDHTLTAKIKLYRREFCSKINVYERTEGEARALYRCTAAFDIVASFLKIFFIDWLYSIRFLIYTALTLIFMTTLATSLLSCTPPNGKTAGLAMGVAGISFVPGMNMYIYIPYIFLCYA